MYLKHWHHVHKLCSAGGKGKLTQGVFSWSWKEFSTPRFCPQVTTSHPITLWQTRCPRRIQIIPLWRTLSWKKKKPDTCNSYSLIAERQSLTSTNWPMTFWQTVPQRWATARLEKSICECACSTRTWESWERSSVGKARSQVPSRKPGLEDMVLGWGRAADPSPRLLLLSPGIKDHSLNVY